jgi:hypothetical protein
MSLVLNVEILGEFKNLTAATKGAQTQLQKLNARTASISNGIRNSLAAIGIGFSLRTVINGIQESVQAASNLEQQFGALDSVFKDLSPSMQKFSRSLSPIGLSAADASKAMALLGSQLKGYGLPVDQAAKKTKDLTLLAADLAATFGGTTLDAVQSISAVFRGEFDPIEKYGVAIKKSDINARMAADGLKGLTGAALKQAEAQTALTLLFEKTTDAQGQANRESESYAAQMAFLSAEFENTKAALGEALMPVLIEFAKEIRKNLPEIREFVAGFIDFVKEAGAAALWVVRNKDWLVPMVVAIGSVTAAFNVAILAANAFKAAATLGLSAGALGAGGAVAGIGAGAAAGGFMEGQQKGVTSQIYGEGFKQLGSKTLGKTTSTAPINLNIKATQSAQQITQTLSKGVTSSGTNINSLISGGGKIR